VKKFLAVLGVIFLVVIVVGAIGLGYIAYRGNALDKESKAYVDTAIAAIVTNWNKKELLERASPEFKQAVTDAQIDQLFHQFAVLGRFITFDSATGQALAYVSPKSGKIITAEYQAKCYFEKGGAMIKVKLIKHADQWQILSLNVDSPQFTNGAASRDDALDKESKAYADAAIPAIITDWNEKSLLDRASPEFKQAVSKQKLDQLFHGFAGFGHLRKCESAQGHASVSSNGQVGAEYFAKATFTKGQGLIDISLIKRANQWQIIGFYVKPPESAPK
jgi:hypothetical protein